MLYEKPNMEIMELKSKDIICESNYYDGTENNTTVSGSWAPTTN